MQLHLGSTGCQPVVSGSLPETCLWLRSASCRTLQASSLRSPEQTSPPRRSHLTFEIVLHMRAIWKGSISFGLVNIPIGLYPATRKEELKFRLLRAKDLSPVNYKRVAEKDGKEVPWDEIVKGYEYEKGKYVVLKDEDFQRVDLEATQTVPADENQPSSDRLCAINFYLRSPSRVSVIGIIARHLTH